MKRGPYKRYLDPKLSASVPRTTRKRLGINDDFDPEVIRAWKNATLTCNNQGSAVESNPDEPCVSPKRSGMLDREVEDQPMEIEDDQSMESDSNSDSSAENDMESADEDGTGATSGSGKASDHLDLVALLLQWGKFRNFQVTKSFGEILMMILTLAMKNNLTLTALEDLMAFVNEVLSTSLFPSEKYHLKKLLNPCSGMKYHIVCQFCGHYLGVKGEKNKYVCEICTKEHKMKGYVYDKAFVTFNVSSQIKRILKNNSDYLKRDCGQKVSDGNCDISDGSMYQKVLRRMDSELITCTFNCDSSPISKDSKMCIVPISLMINELKLEVRSSNIILAGLWYGREKERVDVFLKPFVDEMNFLLKSGITVEISGVSRHFKVAAICCCVDSIARAPMQGITSVGGYYCCSWCLSKGVFVNGTVKYPCSVLPLPARSRKHFTQFYRNPKEKVYGIQGYSPISTLDHFSMIWGFVPDYMHCVLLGDVRRFLENWLDSDFPGYIGLPKTLSCIDQYIASVKPPKLLRRLPITLRNRKFMKAWELKNWLLFYSIPILHGNLPEKFLSHWSLLVNGMVTLLKDEVTADEIDAAEETLCKFVLQTNKLNGDYEMTYNMHQLLHIAESVRRWGPLWAHTAFPFESFLGKIKRLLKASKGVPQQIFRNLELGISKAVILDNISCGEDAKNFNERVGKGTFPSCSTHHHSDVSLLGKSIPFDGAVNGLPDNCTIIEYRQCIIFGVRIEKHVHGNVKKTDDSYVELIDNTYGICKNILACETLTNDCYIVVQRLLTEDVQGVCHLKRINGIQEIVAVESSMIKCSALNVKTSNGEYICRIPKKHFQINF